MELVRRTCPEDPIRDKRPYHTDQNHPCCYRNRDTINADDPLWHLESSTKKVGKGNTIGDVRSADHEAHHMRVYEDNICLPTKICRFMPPVRFGRRSSIIHVRGNLRPFYYPKKKMNPTTPMLRVSHSINFDQYSWATRSWNIATNT